MKLSHPLKKCVAAAFVAVALTGQVFGQLTAYDDAGEYLISANWTNGANQGFGFTPWVIATNGPDFMGTFINVANSPAFVIASLTNVMGTNYQCGWGVFANGTDGVNKTTAFRGFASPLGTNTFKLQWGSTGAGNQSVTGVGTVHGFIGFSLRNGNSNTNAPYDSQDNTANPDNTALFYLYFLDGASPSTLYFWDGNGVQSAPGTSFSNLGRNNITNAIEAEITPGSDGLTYHLVLKDCVLNQTLFATNGIFLNGGGSVNSAALFCYEATGNQIYNRMQIASPQIAPTISNLQPPDGSIYVNAATTTNLSFEVDSFNSTVVSSAVSIYLNGVLQSGSVFSTASPTNILLGTNSPTLSLDTFYTYTIVAQDANGNVVSNNYTFNTFLPSDIYIDASDYNYSAGQFINNNTPTNAYASLLGTNFVDYQIADLTGTNNTAGYRPGDLVEILSLPTDATGDPIDHANLRANGGTAYNIGFTDTGNWENYTRSFPSANYNLYARAASASGGQFEIEMLANPTATTTNQPLIALGRVNVPDTGGSLIYAGQLLPVTDIYGNSVVMPLSGTTTLRETALQSRTYNLEYLMAPTNTSAVGTLRPYISTASPGPNATGVALTSPVTFTIVNRQTSVTPVTTNNIQLFLNSTNVTGRLVLSSNTAGVTVTWTPTNNFAANFTNTLTNIFTDSASVKITNSWTFVTGTTGGILGSGVWTGLGVDSNWTTAANWTPSTPGLGFSASFASAGATATPVTNNIVNTNFTIIQLNYETNNIGYNTTWIQPGVILTVTNGSTANGTEALQVGAAGNGVDNLFSLPVTNTITGSGGTLQVLGNARGSGLVNALNFQVRQGATNGVANLVTLDMSGLDTLIATVGKFTVGQGGSGTAQSNVTGRVYLARTNTITLLRNTSGQFVVGDSSGAENQVPASLPGSSLYLGMSNALFVDSMNIGSKKSTNNIVRFNPAFTSTGIPSLYIRGSNGLATSRLTSWNIGFNNAETTAPNFVQALVDLSGGTVNAMVGNMVVGEGGTLAADTGFSQGTFTFTGGILNVNNLTNGWQLTNSTATETGIVNVNGTATLQCTNIVLARTNSVSNATNVSGTLNVTNGTVEGNIFAGGGVSTVNVNGGTLIVSNAAGTAAAPLTTLSLASASLQLGVNGSTPAANVNATTVSASGTAITIYSVANVTGPTIIHLISYTGSDPYAGLSLAPLPFGYTGSLQDNPQSIDLSVTVEPTQPQPTISGITFGNGQVTLSGTNNAGSGGGAYRVLTSTNVALPLTNWTLLTNGDFDIHGNFSFTNGVNNARQFYIIEVP